MSLETVAGRQAMGTNRQGRSSREMMLDLETVMDCYNSASHPDVVSGAISEPEAQVLAVENQMK